MQVTGIDPNPYMFEYAQESGRRAGLPPDALDLKIGVADNLPAAEASFDTVICTLVSFSSSFITNFNILWIRWHKTHVPFAIAVGGGGGITEETPS